jgi:hypothetical protein
MNMTKKAVLAGEAAWEAAARPFVTDSTGEENVSKRYTAPVRGMKSQSSEGNYLYDKKSCIGRGLFLG